jgi:hypothetical protein
MATANLDTQLADLPTVAEFEARTLAAADYVVVTDTLAAVTTVTNLTTNNDKTGYALTVTPPTAATISAAVWDEVLHGDHEISGSASVLLQASGAAGDPWLTPLPGSYTEGTAGEILGTITPGGLDAAGIRTAIGLATANLDTQLADLPTVAEFEARTIAAPPTAAAIVTAVEASAKLLKTDGILSNVVTTADGKIDANASVGLSVGDIQDIVDGIIAGLPSAGSGDTAVDHDTGGTDHLRYLTPGGDPIDNGGIVAYLTAEYDAGNYANPVANTVTRSDGRWQEPLMLDAGVAYTIVFYKQGVYSATTVEVTP